ncbi:dTDP-rhamnosyl transferase RfbF [Pseudanabaena sp. lw0831]|uniref:glycosyltransferase n=1 Tax=Pseudanabaena sp. lw0831 TaxID=1357935 RepID=UPI0019167C51|nr:glycosyltransferase family 2 protein [Pseudanabaena sp. lw0831]GBO52266.1 dTDP-rhamnosyl transferase RfbF [Pseudanabaena sp. lw0831]
MQTKVAAYITCYQDQESANRCIQSIGSQSVQVKAIYIVDNSNEPLLLNNKNGLLLIHHHPDNIGIVEGMVKAIEWAIAEGYDFLWTFDQDSVPAQNCLEILIAIYNESTQQNNYKVGIVAPTPSDPRTGEIIEGAVFYSDRFQGIKHNSNVDFYECDSPITSGSLISLAAAQELPPPCIDLFIDGIDLDYGFRLRQKGFHNLISSKATMHHNYGNPIKVMFMNKYRYIQQYSALRHYYICRNHTYLETRFSQGYYRFTSLIQRLRYMLVNILWIILYDFDNKQLKIWACLLGSYHGLVGKLGKIWQSK